MLQIIKRRRNQKKSHSVNGPLYLHVFCLGSIMTNGMSLNVGCGKFFPIFLTFILKKMEVYVYAFLDRNTKVITSNRRKMELKLKSMRGLV